MDVMSIPQLRLWCRPSIIRQSSRNWALAPRFLHLILPPPPPPIRRIPSSPVRTNPSEPRLNPNPYLQGRTFELFEFRDLFGATDTHHFLFIQRYRNGFALTTLEQNLKGAFAAGEVRSHLYTYSNIKLENLEKSCLDILSQLVGADAHAVRYDVVLGKIGVKRRSAEEADKAWFERTFGSIQNPDWGRLRGEVVDFEKTRLALDEEQG